MLLDGGYFLSPVREIMTYLESKVKEREGDLHFDRLVCPLFIAFDVCSSLNFQLIVKILYVAADFEKLFRQNIADAGYFE